MRPTNADADLAAKLKWVTLPEPGMDLTTFPDFFVVGPQRTASTWLHWNLMRHPEVFACEPKELYYFSTLDRPSHEQHITTDLGWYLSFFDGRLPGARSKDEQCRQRYGQPFEPRVRGDFTASYAAGMHEGLIREALVLNPELKVVISVRDPVDRAWAHVRKDLSEAPDLASRDAIEALVDNAYIQACGHYSTYIPRWQRCLRPGHLLLCRFTDVVRRPRELLFEVCDFLGVSADDRFVWPEGTRPKASGPRGEMPAWVRERLEAEYGDERRWLADTCGIEP